MQKIHFFNKYFILFATVAMITETVPFFPFPQQPFLKRQTLLIYHQFQNIYGNQAMQDGKLPWVTPTHKVTQPFSHAVFHINYYISTKRGRWWLTLIDFYPKICSNLRLRVPVRLSDKLKPSFLQYHSAYCHQILANLWLTLRPCIQIVTWPFNHVILQDYVTN